MHVVCQMSASGPRPAVTRVSRVRCRCHGHGTLCDPVTGEDCDCHNNTESDASCRQEPSKRAQPCSELQVSYSPARATGELQPSLLRATGEPMELQVGQALLQSTGELQPYAKLQVSYSPGMSYR